MMVIIMIIIIYIYIYIYNQRSFDECFVNIFLAMNHMKNYDCVTYLVIGQTCRFLKFLSLLIFTGVENK